jgi:hypothetical protein
LAYCEIQLSRSRARAAVEADWPDAYGVDRYVRGTGMDPSAVRGDAAIAARILNCVTAQLNELTDRFVFAGLPQAQAYGIAIGVGVLAKRRAPPIATATQERRMLSTTRPGEPTFMRV